MHLEIKKISDYSVIYDFMKPIWHETYDDITSFIQVEYMVEENFGKHQLENHIKDGLCYEGIYYDESLIGIVGYYLYNDYLYLDKLYIDKQYRYKHIPSFIFNYLEKYHKIIKLKVNKFNEKAISCYLNNGFKITEECVNYIGSGFINYDYYMERNLSSLINDLLLFVKDLFKNDYSGHDYLHTLRVYKNAEKILEKEIANRFIVVLASILHDADDYKLFKDSSNALSIMTKLNIPKNIINKVLIAINEVSYKGKDSVKPSTLEAMIVQDADRLDAIGAIGIARTFAYGSSKGQVMYDLEVKPRINLSNDEYINVKSNTLNHFYEKLLLLKDLMNTEKGKEIAITRHNFLEEFVLEFIEEVKGNR